MWVCKKCGREIVLLKKEEHFIKLRSDKDKNERYQIRDDIGDTDSIYICDNCSIKIKSKDDIEKIAKWVEIADKNINDLTLGDTFLIGGKKVEIKEGKGCEYCYCYENIDCFLDPDIPSCLAKERKDKTDIIFIEVK